MAFFDPWRASVAGLDSFLLGGTAAYFAGVLLAAGLASFFEDAFFAPLLALGASFFWLATRFEAAFFAATWEPCSATAAVWVLVVASALVIVVLFLSAADPRMTIHHSGRPETQGNVEPSFQRWMSGGRRPGFHAGGHVSPCKHAGAGDY